MIRLAGALIVMLAVGAAASAMPTLTYTYTDVGGGLYAYDFKLNNNDGLLLSNAMTLGFQSATLSNIQAIGDVAVNLDVDAANYDGEGGYSKAQDTWIYSTIYYKHELPFPGTSPLTGDRFYDFREGAGFFEFAAGTGPNSQRGDNVPVAHIVAGAAGGTVKGVIARNAVEYNIGTINFSVPEPATLSLLALGGVAMLRRRNSAAGNGVPLAV